MLNLALICCMSSYLSLLVSDGILSCSRCFSMSLIITQHSLLMSCHQIQFRNWKVSNYHPELCHHFQLQWEKKEIFFVLFSVLFSKYSLDITYHTSPPSLHFVAPRISGVSSAGIYIDTWGNKLEFKGIVLLFCSVRYDIVPTQC